MMRKPNSQSLARTGFTLVELLVVITIIAILAGLLLAAASGALGKGEEARIKAQIGQMNGAFEDYKNTLGTYPPNAQFPATGAADANKVLSSFKRHLKKAYPQHRESEQLIRALVGSGTGDQDNADNPNLPGGMTAAEALVFFITKMSDDPRYPISGVGGPSYLVSSTDIGNDTSHQLDPIDNRSWWLEPNIQNLGPRNEEGFFGATNSGSVENTYRRYIIYNDPQSPDPGAPLLRQLNFWYLKDQGQLGPYLYFDASRASSVTTNNDVPAAALSLANSFVGVDSDILNQMTSVHAVKTRQSVASSTSLYAFANDGKFQILHPGRDSAWGVLPQLLIPLPENTADELAPIFPDGPWTLDLADTLTNFTDGTLSDAQP